MADNYSQFSEVFEFKTEEAANLFVKLGEICRKYSDEEITREELEGKPEDYPELSDRDRVLAACFKSRTLEERDRLLSVFGYGTFEFEQFAKNPKQVWVFAEEYGNIDAIAEIAQVVLAFVEDTDTVFKLTWADTCSKPRAGEFGGGWLIAYAGGCEFGNTHKAADEAAARVKARAK